MVIRYANQYLRSAIAAIGQYDGGMPLAAFLKQFFKANSKFGSKDRKYISHLCYIYFRTGKALGGTDIAEKVRAALFLCEQDAEPWSELFTSEWLSQWSDTLAAKWHWLKEQIPGTDPDRLFPWKNELSEGMDAEAFSNAHLVQPDLFLRIRPGKRQQVVEKLDKAGFSFTEISETCIALPNSTKTDAVLEIDREVVIQDLSSQRIAALLQPAIGDAKTTQTVWDCCAASGGKSLLAADLIRNIQLTVSDVRPSIIRNLEERFKRAGVKNYHSFIADLTGRISMPFSSFHIILCDAPCSGSGTWGRTPEQLCFFSEEKIEKYASMQKKISGNVMPYLAAGGYLLYITCSVFKRENEEVVAHILGDPNMQLLRAELLTGYNRKADTMYAALFRKTS